jgi:Low psii accumulation1 / Rep27
MRFLIVAASHACENGTMSNSRIPPDSDRYARLKAELDRPYRGLRRTFYLTFAASGAIGAFVFFFRLLAGQAPESDLQNLGLQLGVTGLFAWLWWRGRDR